MYKKPFFRIFVAAALFLPGCSPEADHAAPGPVTSGTLPSAQGVALQRQLPLSPEWRTFARPLAIGTGQLLLFQRDGQHAVIWRIDWKNQKVESIPVPEITLDKDTRYTALESKDGVWLLGSLSGLIRPNGERLWLGTGFNEPVAVALEDGSALVLSPAASDKTQGSLSNYPMRQLRLTTPNKLRPFTKALQMVERGVMSYDGKANETGQRYRVPRYGNGAVRLQDGRVLMYGGDVTDNFASLIEPNDGDGPWVPKPVAPMPHGRVNGTAHLLPDGRVAVTGAPFLNCYFQADKTRSLDVYDVKTNSWTSLPQMPLVPCSDAYGSTTPAMDVTPDGAIVVGGFLEPHVMVLPRDAKSSTGFASSWLAFGDMPQRRIGGVVQVLSEQQVVVAGGVDTRPFGNSSSQCCYGTAGYDLIPTQPGPGTRSLALGYIGVGVAQRGNRVFAAGGRRFGSTGFGLLRYSALAEMIDLSTGKVQQLPNMPFASAEVNAIWVDDDHVMVSGNGHNNVAGFGHIPDSSNATAVFDIRENRWSAPQDGAFLTDNVSVLATKNSELLLYDGSSGSILLRKTSEAPHPPMFFSHLPVLQRREGGVARQLADGRVVIASGTLRPEPPPEPECPETVPEQDDRPATNLDDVDAPPPCGAVPGPAAAPAEPDQHTVVETITPGTDGNGAKSTFSAKGPDHILTAAIDTQGGVVVLSEDRERKQTRIARTAADGKHWEDMPLPKELTAPGENICGNCQLLYMQDPRRPEKGWLLLRRGAINVDWLGDDILSLQTLTVWWWDDAQQAWRMVLQSDGRAARSLPQALGEPLSPAPGKRTMSMGWHLPMPILWAEP
ncbi:MAG TPA: kelch repeat-containing protein [Gallionellaceae bacterium]